MMSSKFAQPSNPCCIQPVVVGIRGLLLLWICLWPLNSLAADIWSQPHPGIRRLHRQTSNQNINVLVINLCAAGISLRATASSERRSTVSSFGNKVGAHAAINGDFFSFSTYSTNGLSMHAGSVWSGTQDHSYVAPIMIGSHRVELPHHQNITKTEAWVKEIVSGHPTLLDDGKTVGNPGDSLCTARHPRTALGISKDHKTMYWAVVDGRASNRIGMTCPELASLLAGLGAWDAMNMDGGGSSTMWVRNVGVVNRPSDGSERVVANHLAVFARGSGTATHCPCQMSCKGSKIVQDDCSEGDCAAFGATCANDSLGVRCVSVFCPATGKKKVCVNDKLIGDCNNGAISTGDCSQFAALCSTAGSSEARCVSAFCVKDAKEVPKAHDICLPDGRFAQCTGQGGVANAKTCPSGQRCMTVNGKTGCWDPNTTQLEPRAEATSTESNSQEQTNATESDEESSHSTETTDATQEVNATPDAQEGISSSEAEASSDQEPLLSSEQNTTPDSITPAELSDPGELLILFRDDIHEPLLLPKGCGCQAASTPASVLLLLLLGVLLLLLRKR